jgi:hypothetical protein
MAPTAAKRGITHDTYNRRDVYRVRFMVGLDRPLPGNNPRVCIPLWRVAMAGTGCRGRTVPGLPSTHGDISHAFNGRLETPHFVLLWCQGETTSNELHPAEMRAAQLFARLAADLGPAWTPNARLITSSNVIGSLPPDSARSPMSITPRAPIPFAVLGPVEATEQARTRAGACLPKRQSSAFLYKSGKLSRPSSLRHAIIALTSSRWGRGGHTSYRYW